MTLSASNSASGKMFSMRQLSLSVLALNVIGTIAYLWGASHSWAIPEEHGQVPVTGEPFVWFAFIWPIVGSFLLLNLIWGAFILAKQDWRSGRLWLLAPVIWIVPVVVDFAHH